MDDMYRELILDHAKNPRNHGVLEPCDVEYEAHNPLCGDRLHLTLRVDPTGRITAIGWEGDGCAISQASASMLGEEILGKTVDEIRTMSKDTLLEMLGIPLSPNRLKCALLSLEVLKIGLYGREAWRETEDE
ncbi:MAG: SUF system NifU family Fe-S cluster assembly protein [Anaerolineae bacterium]|nr:SUF system NifU family Fe-S cluster assembly protein [Anaerolineae bacterium]